MYLLELAIWRVSCLNAGGGIRFPSMQAIEDLRATITTTTTTNQEAFDPTE
jgi:hypothetical protein